MYNCISTDSLMWDYSCYPSPSPTPNPTNTGINDRYLSASRHGHGHGDNCSRREEKPHFGPKSEPRCCFGVTQRFREVKGLEIAQISLFGVKHTCPGGSNGHREGLSPQTDKQRGSCSPIAAPVFPLRWVIRFGTNPSGFVSWWRA